MGKLVLLYGSAILFFIAGFFLLREGLRQRNYNDMLVKIHYVPVKRYGRIGHIILGVFSILCGVILLFLKVNK